MVITIDLPKELVCVIDKLIAKRPEPPVWPFKKRAVKFSRLSFSDRKKLETFQTAMRAYNDYPTIVKPERGSRSAIVEELLRLQLHLPIVPAPEETKPSTENEEEARA